MADRVIEIIVETNDQTGGALGNIQKSLLAMDKVVQRMQNKLRALGLQRFAATVRLIDRVTQPGSRINSFLKSLASKVYNITMRVTDSAGNKIRQIEASLMKLAGRAWTIGINVRDNVAGKVKGLTDGLLMGMGGMGVGMLGTAGIGYGVVNAAQSYMNFEQQMSRVQAVRQLDKNSSEMQALTQQAKDLGAQTAWTRQQVGEAQYYQALAGWDTEQILKSTPHMLNLASAGGMDLGRASDMVTDTMTAFGLKATERYVNKLGQSVNVVEGYTDMLAKIQAISNTDLSQAYEALKYSAPVLGTIGRGKSAENRMQVAEDALIATGLMADAGIKGSMSGTALRAVFSRFSSENRNALFGLRTMGVEVQRNGEMLLPGEIIKSLKKRVDEGIDPNDLLNIAETFAGEKIHADTRRKLESFIADTTANGGKIGSAGLMKMASMLAGQEAMSGLLAMMSGDWDAKAAAMDKAAGTAKEMANIQLDNLAGELTRLGSAWDAFQQGFFEGSAGDGLRSFVQSLTEVISRAQKLFSDGIGFGDIGKIIFDVIDRLKNKFLELDGIGSVLAGGALMAGLAKVGSMIQKTIGYFRTLRGLEIGQRLGGTSTGAGGQPPVGLGGGQSVGTMNVTAGVVNVNGKVNGGAGGRRIGDTSIIDRYNRERERIRGSGTPPPPPAPSRLSTMRGAAMGGAAFAAIFGALDVFNSKAVSAERAQEAASQLAAAQKEYRELQAQGYTQAELGEQARRIAELQATQTQVAKENAANERHVLGGATGAVLGSAMGAALGSLAGPVGTMLGGIVGGIIGEKLGGAAAEFGNEQATTTTATPQPDFFGFGEKKEIPTSTATPPVASMADFKIAEDASRNYYLRYQREPRQHSRLEDRQQGAIARQARIEREAASQTQIERFEKINDKLSQTGVSPFQHTVAINAATDYYKQQREAMAKTPEQFAKANAATGDLATSFKNLGNFFDDLFFNKAAAAELNPEQLAQQTAMERGMPVETQTPESISAPETEMTSAETPLFDFEQIISDVTSFGESIVENFNGIGTSIFETLSGAFDGVGEIFSGLGESISENLSAALEGAGEMFSGFGEVISANLSSAFDVASEMFSGFGELVSSSLATAQSAAESALAAIGAAFDSTKSAIQSAWGELPGFFSGIFDSLGGVAAAAGAAIYSGLTSVIGAVIGAWQSAASTVSGIIASISSMASSVAGMIPSFGGGKAFAEGGFVNSPTQALVGEAGAEVIIPLSVSRRARAMELFEKTAAILGGNALSFGGDELANDFIPPNFDDDIQLPTSTATLSADNPVTTSTQNNSSNEISLGGIQATFNITSDNAQEVLQTIRENLAELADNVAARLAITIDDAHHNQPLEA